MEVFEQALAYYFTPAGRCPFREWFYSLGIESSRDIVRARLARVRTGNFGDCESVGDGVLELRVHEGPGFRVYLAREDKRVVLLLLGGMKKKQTKDIALAKVYWADHRRRFK